MKHPRRSVPRGSTLPRLTPEREHELRTAVTGMTYGSQKKIAAQLGLSPTALRHWRKKFGLPSFTQADRLAWINAGNFPKSGPRHNPRLIPRITGVPRENLRMHGDMKDEFMIQRLKALEEEDDERRKKLLKRAKGGEVAALILLYELFCRLRLPLVEEQLTPEVRERLPWIARANGNREEVAA